MITAVDCTIIRFRRNLIEPKYFHYFAQSHEYFRQVEELIGGATRQRISRSNLGNIILPCPPLSEQQRIVDILDETLGGLATATENAEKNLNNARELFDSHLNSVFGQNWGMQALGDISENLDSKRVPITKHHRKSGDIPYYGASGPVDCVDGFIFDEDLLLVSEDGANLVMRNYPIAFSIAGKSWVNNHAHVLRFSDLASQRFVEFYLNSISLMPYVSGMAQPKLNQRALNSIPVPWPKQDERENVVARIEQLAAQTDRLRELYETRISALTELKQSILGKAFSGGLTSRLSRATKEAAE
jgi:type I restriction enzyme S subunit